VRLFIAANPGEQFRHLLATQLDAWRSQLGIAWSRPQTWHLTLDFLGEVPPAKLNSLKEALQAEAAGHPPLAVQPQELGGFPNLQRPRVLFLHMASDGALEKLAAGVRQRVDEALPEGEQDRKPFRAHLTIARIKRPLPASQLKLIPQIQFVPWETLMIDAIHLVKSELRPGGARHTDLAVFPLGSDR
jgi:2'-5' RNA ligase